MDERAAESWRGASDIHVDRASAEAPAAAFGAAAMLCRPDGRFSDASKWIEIDRSSDLFSGTQRWSQNSTGLSWNPCFSAILARSRHGGRESLPLRQT
jgi:hypothetical protein